ncbi:MAG: hypothetical protein JKY70_13795 [Mucilaginibacter sp.]|nr:hypothetical protein [Mucilaginibacter sp.]
MENLNQPSQQQQQLTKEDILESFVKVITDTRVLKKYLLSQLPALSSVTRNADLKMLIVFGGVSLQNQIMRMDMAMQQLNAEYLPGESLRKDGLDVSEYLWKGFEEGSNANEVLLLQRLVLIVGLEVNSFRLLESISRTIYPKTVNRLMKANLSEALVNERSLLKTYHSYLKT